MSNDLISRKALMECAEYDANFNLVIPYNKVANAQTAYDVDAVINELESVKRKLNDCWAPEDKCLTTECTDCALEKAIEIVRNGGNQK